MPTSRSPQPRSRAAAFTLVEVLLVLVLLALIASVLLPAAGALLHGQQGESAEETALAALQDARRQAVLSGREVALRFDPEARALAWSDGRQAGRRAFAARETEVDFLRPGAGAILLGGQLVETDPVGEMIFYADGTCDTIRLQLREAGATPHVIPIDPWTCAPVLPTVP